MTRCVHCSMLLLDALQDTGPVYGINFMRLFGLSSATAKVNSLLLRKMDDRIVSHKLDVTLARPLVANGWSQTVGHKRRES